MKSPRLRKELLPRLKLGCKTVSYQRQEHTERWLSLHRYENGCAYFHEEEREGLAKICRLALHSCYEDFVVDGFNVLYNKKPVIYLSAAARPGLGQYLCNQVIWDKVDM